MNWAATSKPLSKLAGTLAAASVAYALLRNTGFYEFTGQDAEGLYTLILLIGSIYAVMLAFVIFVIWGQFTDVENAVMRECTALTDLLRFGQYLNADAHRAIRRAVGDYAQRVIQSEWPALGERNKDQLAGTPACGSLYSE